MASVHCKQCRQVVPARWPQGGDGSTVLASRHANSAGAPCAGSGAAHDVGDDDVEVAGLVVNDGEPDEDAGEAVDGILRRRTIGTVVRRVIHQNRLFQLEYRRCGKRAGGPKRPNGCKCMRSNEPKDWHGPYPYAYATRRKQGGGAYGAGGWKRLTTFPRVGYKLLGIEEPNSDD